jgi:uncharacterized membrane protein YjjP (DUF1212 family)
MNDLLTRRLTYFLSAAALFAGAHGSALALTLGGDFSGHYTAASLGSIAGLPTSYGGLTLKAGPRIRCSLVAQRTLIWV